MKEQDIYRELKIILNDYFFKRIENTCNVGTPDIYFSHRNGRPQGWIELKQISLPKKMSTEIKIPFRPGQLSWINQAQKYGIIVVVFVGINSNSFAFTGDSIKEKYENFETFLNNSVYFSDIRSKDKSGQSEVKSFFDNLN